MTTSRKPKYITYCIIVRGGMSHGHEVTCTGNFAKFECLVFWDTWADRHTDMLIEVVFTPLTCKVTIKKPPSLHLWMIPSSPVISCSCVDQTVSSSIHNSRSFQSWLKTQATRPTCFTSLFYLFLLRDRLHRLATGPFLLSIGFYLQLLPLLFCCFSGSAR